ncbi:MAG: hypothetical protein H6623_06690 [Bdellovibrionaceae bacterium]|nr:hypothetical protein [Pseudobdellovibrionaceae bacterium]
MKITDRSYGGKIFRPHPEVFINDEQTLFIAATPWGQSAIAKDFIDLVTDYWRDAINDPQKTSVYQSGDVLDAQEHLFKMSILAAHEDIHDKYNDGELLAGLEFVCFLKHNNKLSWFQVGAPTAVLLRNNAMTPLFHPVDFSFDFSTPQETLPPLPKELLGLQKQLQIYTGKIRLQEHDRFLLVSRSYIPSQFFQNQTPESLSLDSATAILAQENQEHPFWIALLLMD